MMNRLLASNKGITLLVLAFLLFFTTSVSAAIPENLNYQGKLKDNVGTPITTPTTIQFSIYNHISNGAPTDVPSPTGPLLWTEIYDQGAGNCIQIDPDDSGIFGQRLGICVSFPAYMDFTDEYYIGVKVGADGEATPRIPLSSNPYAHRAGGLYADSEDIQVETENSGNVVFNSAGNVQMTSNDVTPALIINQLGTGNLFEVQDNGVTSFVILDGGNVGIGTSTPRTSLELDGAFLATGIYDEGWTEPDLGEGARMMWYPRRAAFRAGYVDGTQWDHGEIGDYSVAMGYSTIASGNYAFAVGEETTASGTAAVAMGSGTQATDTGSIAMGSNTTSSGNGSIAMGSGATSTMDGSIAIGHNTTASHDGATAMGYGTTASGHFATALGQGTIASGDWATAMGSGIEASSTYTIAIGLDNMTGTNCNQANSLCVMGGEVGIGTIAPLTALHIDSNGTNTTAILTLENTAGDFQVFRTDATPESAITGSVGDLAVDGTSGDMYIKNTGTGTNTGWEQLATGSGASTFLALTDTPPAYTAGSLLFTSGSVVTEDNANLFWDDTTNRLGIGTSTPGESLEVSGNIYVNAGQVLINPIDAWENPLQVYESVGGDVAVSIQVNGNSENSLNIKDNNSNTVKINGNGDTFFNGGNVGIGTASPEVLLDLNGRLRAMSHDSSGLAPTTGAGFEIFYSSNSNYGFLFAIDRDTANDDLMPIRFEGTPIDFWTGNDLTDDALRMRIGSSGAITFNQAYTFPAVDGGLGDVLQTNGTGTLSWESNGGSALWTKTGTDLSPTTSGDDLVLNDTEDLRISSLIEGAVLFAGPSGLVSEDNASFFWDDVNDRLGIGDATPSYTLDINGKIGIDGVQTIYNAQAEDGLTGSLVIGDGGTNLTHTAGSEGHYNTFIGIGSGDANTTGHSNMASGALSLYANTTGNYNTASGGYSLYDLTEGVWNTAIGYGTGWGITTGDYNTIIGANVTGLTADLNNNIIIADGLGNIRIQAVGSGAITFNENYTFPTADGTNGQVLETDGSGALTWNTISGSDSDWSGVGTGTMYATNTSDDVLIGATTQTGISGRNLYVEGDGSAGAVHIRGSSPRSEWYATGNTSGSRAFDMVVYSDAMHLRILDDGFSTANDILTASLSEIAFNESSTDQDFRIESNDEVNMFFIDAGNNRVGIGTNAPVHNLQVSGHHDLARILIHDSQGNNDDEAGLLFAVSGDLSTSPAKGGIFFNRTDTYGRGDLIFATDNNADSTEVAKDDIRMFIKSRGEVIVGDATPTHISGSGSLYVDQYIEIGKSLYVGSQIVRRTDLDTYIDFENEDEIEIRAGGVRMLSLIEGVSDSVVINEYSSDVDFRVEGDTEANLFFVDAGTDNVGINTNTPRTALEISGDGAILATGTFGSGWTEPDLGAGTRMVWYPQKSAFRVGRVTGTHWNETNIGNYSVAMGYDTAASGDYSTAIGGRTTASEDYTFATGYNTSTLGRYSSTFGSGSRASGRYSMAIGYSSDVAGNYAFTGGSNMQPTSGDGTFVWGYSASAQAFAPSNNRFLIFPQGDDGMVGVGTVSPASILELEASAPILTIDSAADNDAEINLSENGTVQWNIYNDGDNSDRLYITDNDNDNGVYIAQDATSWTANSDIRLKENVITIDNALEGVLGMRGVRYNFIGTDNTEIGVIAQEVEGYFPEIVDTDGEYWGVSYSRIAPILIEAIKELHIKIDSLGDLGDNEEFVSLLNDLVDRVDGVETRLDDNDTEVDLLKSENEALKSDNVLMKEDLCVLGIERWCEE